MAWTVARQRPDGSWPYGEERHLNWVDGFHTGYVLDCLLDTVGAGGGGASVAASWQRGLEYYMANLIETKGRPVRAGIPVSDRRPMRSPGNPNLSRAARLEPMVAGVATC